MNYAKARITENYQFIDWDGTIRNVVFLDFETYYGTGCTLQSLTYPEYYNHPEFKFHGVGIAINDGEYYWVTETELEGELTAFDWENTVLVVQNGKFDASLLLWEWGIRPLRIHDTQAMSNAIHPGQGANLDAMLRREFPDDPSMWKGEELASFKNVRYLNEDQEHILGWVYCKKDVLGMRALWVKWIVQLPYLELRIMQETLDLYLTPKFELDERLVQEYLDDEIAEEKALVKKSGYPKTRLSSNPKFAEILTEDLGLKIPRKISPRTQEVIPALAQSDDALIRLMADHPEFKHIWDARKAVKSTGMKSRAKRLIELARAFDGKLPIPLNYGAAHTLRWGGTQKVNPQNFKRGSKIRKSLRAPKGYLVYVVDSSNIEARMIAWLANELEALEKFRAGIDTYNDMAEKIYGYPVDRKLELEDGTKPYFEEGNVGKTAKLGLGFGMGGPKFQVTLASGPMGAPPIYKPLDFCTQAVNIFREDNPNIVMYWQRMQQAIFDMMLPGVNYQLGPLRVKHETLELPNGIALKYPNIRYRTQTVRQLMGDDTVIEREERNLYCDRKDGASQQKLYGGIVAENVTQRASRDVVAEQAIDCLDEFQDVLLGLLVHDEGVFIMPDDHPEERLERLIYHFSKPRDWCADLPLAAEGGFDECYSK